MPYIEYVPRSFSRRTMAVVDQANEIIADYQQQGFKLTLRQLYYRFVAGGLIPNEQREYKRLGSIINDARLAGLVDWDAIEDRTRELHALPHWEVPEEVIAAAAEQYREELWRHQRHRVEVWVEKEALAGVFQRICDHLHVPMLSCRGYTSQSEMWTAAMRLQAAADHGQECVILHFGDHDPSGIDMTRDIEERLVDVFGTDLLVQRIALNMDQVRRYDPPPNPAKLTDSRAGQYLARFGRHSWELDALEPRVLAALVERHVLDYRDEAQWEADLTRQEQRRSLLERVSEHWTDVVSYLEDQHGGGQE